jgi:hypothetical protein
MDDGDTRAIILERRLSAANLQAWIETLCTSQPMSR